MESKYGVTALTEETLLRRQIFHQRNIVQCKIAMTKKDYNSDGIRREVCYSKSLQCLTKDFTRISGIQHSADRTPKKGKT